MTVENLNNYFISLSREIKIKKEIINKKDFLIASKFDPLDFFKVGENKTSEIIAYFLNPKAKHSQNELYIKKFCEIIVSKYYKNWETLDFLNITINCEQLTDENRRIDIVIDFGNFKIGIENKIWAIDQPNQLSDYIKHLNEKSDDYLLFYLTPYGKLPTELSIKQDDFDRYEELQLLSYCNDIIPLIEDWRNHSKPENVRNFLTQFVNHLNNKFMPNPTESELIIDHALLKEENLEIFNLCAQNYEILKTKLIESFFEVQLSNLLELKSFTFKNTQKIDKQIIKYRHIRIFNPKLDELGFSISFWFDYAGKKYNKLNYAFIRNVKNVECSYESELKIKFKDKFKNNKGEVQEDKYGTVIISKEMIGNFMWDDGFKGHSLKIIKGNDFKTIEEIESNSETMIGQFYSKIIKMLEIVNEIYGN